MKLGFLSKVPACSCLALHLADAQNSPSVRKDQNSAVRQCQVQMLTLASPCSLCGLPLHTWPLWASYFHTMSVLLLINVGLQECFLPRERKDSLIHRD